MNSNLANDQTTENMNQPHLAIIHIDSIPSDAFTEFCSTVQAEGLMLSVNAREDGVAFAAIEWLIPTAVIAYISKSYFDGFLKEMGKDHYALLKLGLLKFRTKLFGETAPEVLLVGSKGKISNEQPYSLAFSILAEAGPRLTFKLLIQKDVSEQEFVATIELFLDLLATFHTSGNDDYGQTRNAVGGTLLLAYNRETKALEILDPIQSRNPLPVK